MSETDLPLPAQRPARVLGARNEQIVLGIIGTLGFLVVWESAATLGWLNPVVVSNPSRIAAAFVRQFEAGEIFADLQVTMVEFAFGFGLALVFGVALGIAMGLSRLTEYAV